MDTEMTDATTMTDLTDTTGRESTATERAFIHHSAASPLFYLHAQKAAAARKARLQRLAMLKMQLAIFVYRQPVDNRSGIIDVIENAETQGEVQLLLDYVLGGLIEQRSMRAQTNH